MNKRTQIGLVLVITLVLLLGLTIPSMAKKNPTFSCSIDPLIVNKDGQIMTYTMKVYGELEAYWEDGTLVNICTGTVPLGETINPSLTYADFDVYCSELPESCDKGVFTYVDYELGKIWDPDGGYFTPDSRTLVLKNNGKFTFSKLYTP